MKAKEFISRYWIGIVVGVGVAIWFFTRNEQAIVMSVQEMSIVPAAEVSKASFTGIIEGVFGVIGGAIGGVSQRVFGKK